MKSTAAIVLLLLAGCATPDADLGRVNAHNLSLQQGPDDGRVPRSGGSAVTGAAAVKRYNNGTIIQPAKASSTQGSQ